MTTTRSKITFLTPVPADALLPVHRLLLEAMGFEITPRKADDSYMIHGNDISDHLWSDAIKQATLTPDIREHHLMRWYITGMNSEPPTRIGIIQDILLGCLPQEVPHVDLIGTNESSSVSFLPPVVNQWAMRVDRYQSNEVDLHQAFRKWADSTTDERPAPAPVSEQQPCCDADTVESVKSLEPNEDAMQACQRVHAAITRAVAHGLEVDAVLVVSSAHITEEEKELLELNNLQEACPGNNLMVSMAGEYGWMFFIESVDADAGLSEGFAGVIRYAKEHGFTWVRLDSGGDELAGLPTYDW